MALNFCITRLRVRFIKIILFGCRGIVDGIIVRNQLISISDNKRESYRILGKFLKNNGRDNLILRKALEGHSKRRGHIATFTMNITL
jgi:hypothetical protein